MGVDVQRRGFRLVSDVRTDGRRREGLLSLRLRSAVEEKEEMQTAAAIAAVIVGKKEKTQEKSAIGSSNISSITTVAAKREKTKASYGIIISTTGASSIVNATYATLCAGAAAVSTIIRTNISAIVSTAF